MDPRRLLPYFLGLAMCAVLTTAVIVLIDQRSSSRDEQSSPVRAEATTDGPREVLAEWDSRRSRAWADGDVTALRDLYVDDSRTGRADARMLAAYVERGLRVEGLTTQVLALEVLDQATDELTVRVTDRVVGGVVTGDANPSPLPRDRPSTRTLTVRRVGGAWLMVAVRDQASAAASTSRTSTSWKS